MKASVSLYSFNQYIRAGKLDVFGAIDKAAEMGFEGMEFTVLLPDAPKNERIGYARKVRAAVEAHGMAVVAYLVSAHLWNSDGDLLRQEIERVKNEIDIAEALGAPLFRHDLTTELDKAGAGRSFIGMIPHLAETVREIADYAAAKGIRTCSENHGYIAQDSYRLEMLCAAVNHDNYGILADFGNFMFADEDSAVAVSRLANFAFHAHAKDFLPSVGGTFVTRTGNRITPVAIGDGTVPVKRCLGILARAGYDGWVTIEYEGTEDCISAVGRSLVRLNEYIKEAEAEADE